MDERPESRWDLSGLCFGLGLTFGGILVLLGRSEGTLRPMLIVGVAVLAVGAAYLISALDRAWPDAEADRPVELP